MRQPPLSANPFSKPMSTGLAPRIFFIFPPFLREGGGGVRGEGGIPLKSEEKGGQKGGGGEEG